MANFLLLVLVVLNPGVNGLSCDLRDGISAVFQTSTFNCFLVSRTDMDLDTAVQFCEGELGGHLAFLETEDEAVVVQLSVSSNVWIGIERTGSVWYWRHWGLGTRVAATFTKWLDTNSSYEYGILGRYPYWRQVGSRQEYRVLCELEEQQTQTPEYVSGTTAVLAETVSCLLTTNNSPGKEHRDFGFKKFQRAPVDSFQCTQTFSALSKITCVRECAVRNTCCAVGFSQSLKMCCIFSTIADETSFTPDKSFIYYNYTS